jgi:hypothetical protein
MFEMIFNDGKIAIYRNSEKSDELEVYGDAGWDAAIFTDGGLKTFVKWLRENKPEVQ